MGTGEAVGVGEGAGGRVAVAVGVDVMVAGRVLVADGVAVDGRVGLAVGVGVAVGTAVGVSVGVGSGGGVSVGVNVAVGGGTGVASSKRKLARADEPSRQSAATLIVTVCPGDPVTEKLPDSVPAPVLPEPEAWPGGIDVTETVAPGHQPVPESVPLEEGAGPDEGLSASVGLDWAAACVTGPGQRRSGGIHIVSSAATRRMCTRAAARFMGELP